MRTSTALSVVVITNMASAAIIVVPAALMGAPSWACWVAGTIGWLVTNSSRYASGSFALLSTAVRLFGSGK